MVKILFLYFLLTRPVLVATEPEQIGVLRPVELQTLKRKRYE